MPLQQIEGMVTSGSINIDGSSTVRRTCSLSLVADEDLIINDFYWGVKSKFKLEIGLKNTIDTENYPEIIWFPQGIYIISGFNTSQSTNSYNISISGKDKMCMLNGDLGGSLPASIDFGVEEFYDSVAQEITYSPVPIKTIIREALHTYAKEPYYNIIINDLDEASVELLEYKGDTPLYLLNNIETQQFENYTDNGDIACEWRSEDSAPWSSGITLSQIGDIGHYDPRVELDFDTTISPTQIRFLTKPNSIYTIAKLEYGQTAGYRYTDLTYAGDLISSIGESLTSILDKIKAMLGEYEYFYDLDGRFIFQRKKTYIQRSWNNIKKVGDEEYAESGAYSSANSYVFEDGQLVTSFQNSPNLANLKNDFSVWGNRKSISGADIPIHYRYAIDTKPIYYKALDGKIYSADEGLLDRLKEELRNKITNEVTERVKNFQPKHMGEIPIGLPAPQRNPETYLYSPGWWDIEDWHDFYLAVTNGEEPCYTMKWYSKNNLDGCVKVKDVPLLKNTDSRYWDRYVWLIVIYPNGTISIGHGNGYPTDSEIKTKYKSVMTGLNTFRTFPVNEQGEEVLFANAEKKTFIYPYAGCADTHTYLSFLMNDVKKLDRKVYFYNPNFPNIVSDEDALKEQIEKELAELTKNYHFVDWREVIYQMALDFYAHGTEDNFLSNIAKNNRDYYPDGRTGYEQYYLDLQGFWRQLYNISPDPIYEDSEIYSKNDEFKYPAENENSIELFTKGKWEEILNIKDEDPNDLFALRHIVNQEGPDDDNLKLIDRWEFVPWLDAIILNDWNEFDNADDPLSLHFYTVGKNGQYNKIAKSVQQQIRKNELFVFENGKYVSLLNSSRKYDFGNDSPKKVYKFNKDNDVFGVWGYDSTLKQLYFNDATQLYQKYLYQSKLDIQGMPMQKTIPIKKSIAYLNKTYNYIVQDDPIGDKYDQTKKYWTKQIINDPSSLNFWFDFLDADTDSRNNRQDYLGYYSTRRIGDRSKSINDNKVTSIYFREVPNLIFSTWEDYKKTDLKSYTGYTPVFVSGSLENMFHISAQGKSAQDAINELLYNYTYCAESITLQAIPVYYLQPNTRISVMDEKSKINGEYIVSRISLPLSYNGTMSITATKAPERLY